MVIVYLTLITSLIASLCHFYLTLSGFEVLRFIPNTCQIDRLLREAFRIGYIQHETSIQQVVKDRDLRLRKGIVGTPSHSLQDLFPPLPPFFQRGGLYAVSRILTRSHVLILKCLKAHCQP